MSYTDEVAEPYKKLLVSGDRKYLLGDPGRRRS